MPRLAPTGKKSLRRRAEARLRAKFHRPPAPAAENLKTVVQELRVHQMELKIQNEEMRRVQVELAQSRDRYTDLFEFAPAGYVALDGNGVIREANLTAASMLGTDRGELLGQRFYRFVTRSSQDAFFLHRQKLFASSAREVAEVELHGTGAEPLVVELQSILHREGPGGRFDWRMAFLDVGARKRAELELTALNQELQRSRQALDDFFEAAPIGLMWVAPNGCITRVNAAELKLLDRPLGEVLGHSVLDLHHDRAPVEALLDRLAQGETVKYHHLAVRSKPGTLRQLLVDANGLWAGGRLEHSHWFVRDITERQLLEGQVLTIAERERARIGHELHDDLCQQLVSIEYQNEALINEWAAAAPASVAKGREISALVRRVIEHARDLSRGLSPNVHFEPDGIVLALQELAERTERVFQRTCRFECGTAVRIRDDATNMHLFRIAQEAVGNALKHSRATRIDLRFEARDRAVVLRVDDNGIGIPVPLAPGPGSGLRIMQYRANLIGASLVVERSAGGGTSIVCAVNNIVPAPP